MFKKINFSSVYFKGTIDLLKGSLWAQIIGFFGALCVAKLYGAEELGMFSKYISLSNILAIFFTLRLESAIILSNTKEKQQKLFSSLCLTIISLTIISLIIVLFLPDSFFNLVNFLKKIICISILGGLLKAFENVYASYLIKDKSFQKVANSRVFFTIIRYFSQIALFFTSISNGIILGYLFASILLILYFYKQIKIKIFSLSFSSLKSHLKENLNLVSFGVLSDNLNVLNLQFIPLIGGIYFSDKYIGWYFLAITILNIPIHFVNTSFSKTFFLKVSEIYNDNYKRVYSFVKKSLVYLIILFTVPFLILAIFGNTIILFLFDENWKDVGTYLQYLSVLFFFRTIYNPISNLEEVFKKNHIGLIFNCYLLIINILAIYLGNQQNSFLTVLKTTAIWSSIGYVIVTFYFLLITKRLSLK